MDGADGTKAKSERFLALLRSAGCPGVDQLSGEDLEWLWNPASCSTPADGDRSGGDITALMDWLVDGAITDDMILSEDELRRWQQIDERDILRGAELEAALQNEDAIDKPLSEEEIRKAHVRDTEEINLTSASIDTTTRLFQVLAAKVSRDSIKLSDMEQQSLSSAKNLLRSRQEQCMQCNETMNTAVDDLTAEIEMIFQDLQSAFESSQNLLSALNLNELKEAEDSFTQAVETFAAKRKFTAPSGSQGDCKAFPPTKEDISILRERSDEEQVEALCEIDRLLTSVQNWQLEKVLVEAKLKGIQCQIDFVGECLQKRIVLETDAQKEIGLLLTESTELENNLKQLQGTLNSELDDTAILVKCQAHLEGMKIYFHDAQTQLHREVFLRNQLETLARLLMDQRVRQSLLEILVHQEKGNLTDLLDKLNFVFDAHFARPLTEFESERQALHRVRALEKEKNESDIIPESDYAIKAVVDIIRSKKENDGRAQSLMTTYEAKKLFQDFFGRIHDDEKAAETRKAQMKEQAKALESKLAALKRLLNLDCPKSYQLSNPEIANKVHQADNELRAFKDELKDAMSWWDKEKQLLKKDPTVSAQKRLWVDFLTKPKACQRTVEAMKDKSEA